MPYRQQANKSLANDQRRNIQIGLAAKLMDAQGKAKAAYKQSQLAADKELWRQIQNQVSSAYSKDQSAYEEAQLKAQV